MLVLSDEKEVSLEINVCLLGIGVVEVALGEGSVLGVVIKIVEGSVVVLVEGSLMQFALVKTYFLSGERTLEVNGQCASLVGVTVR